MEDNNNTNYLISDSFVKEITRYISYWKVFLISISFFVISALIYLRYATNIYSSSAKIEILDDSMDSEMALPTAMTIFNRSMINLENDIEIIKSYRIVRQVVDELELGTNFYTTGYIKTTQNHLTEWMSNLDYELEINRSLLDPESLYKFVFDFDRNSMTIDYFFNDQLIETLNYSELSTDTNSGVLPFYFSLNETNDDIDDLTYFFEINPSEYTALMLCERINVNMLGKESDLLSISLESPNILIAEETINTLLNKFDNDGIKDRQLVFKRTIDFVNSRFNDLKSELDKIEISKQKFKETNDLTEITYDISSYTTQEFAYDAELFNAQSQLELVNLLINSIKEEESDFFPINLGLENNLINELINDFNKLLTEKLKYSSSGGSNNTLIKNIDIQLSALEKNIKSSLINFKSSLDVVVKQLSEKENQFSLINESVPENEKILRSIEREQEIKEALFLLLLQKKEEAEINFAVTKPSIKVIDYAITNPAPIHPKKIIILLISIFIGTFIPFLVIYLIFLFDDKIHTKAALKEVLSENIPIIAEIPYITEESHLRSVIDEKSRIPLAESIRMIVANLNFMLFNSDSKLKNNRILVTSSIKGEGKTLVSINFASSLSAKYPKVILLGCDLRNPQLHKFLGLEKSKKGISDIIYRNDLNWKDLIIKNNKLDILLSGTIPPNPTELLSSDKFKSFIDDISKIYDYIVIDSAPCLLVSDTFEISKLVDNSIYLVRANHTSKDVIPFINETFQQKKLSNINVVFNSVGNSSVYGYKYGYQYGYKYGYKYGYNYGYGYGYGDDGEK